MPLCHSKVEEVTTEDLVELSEIEKRNLGQVCPSFLNACCYSHLHRNFLKHFVWQNTAVEKSSVFEVTCIPPCVLFFSFSTNYDDENLLLLFFFDIVTHG